MSRNITHPVYESRSGWNAHLPLRQPRMASAALDRFYDYAIVGAGYTGLAAAHRLAELEPKAAVLLLEATTVGEGSAGRNMGFVIGLSSHAGRDARLAGERDRRLADAGRGWLKNLLDTRQVDCDWQDAERIYAAATRHGQETLRRRQRYFNDMGLAAVELPQEELVDRIGSRYYRYAFAAGRNSYVQPAALVRGLADSLPENVTLAELTPVGAVDTVRNRGLFVRTRNRDIQAGKIIVANNGFARELGFLRDRLITIYTYAGMTPALSVAELAQHGRQDAWGMLPAHRLGTTLRKTRHDRFLVRSGYSYAKPLSQYQADRLLTQRYRARYPQLASHRFEYVWAGATAFTRGGESYFGEVSKGIYAAAGYNGSGILRGVTNGKLLAEMALGGRSQELSDALAMSTPGWLPPEPVRRVAVATAIGCGKKRAGREY